MFLGTFCFLCAPHAIRGAGKLHLSAKSSLRLKPSRGLWISYFVYDASVRAAKTRERGRCATTDGGGAGCWEFACRHARGLSSGGRISVAADPRRGGLR